MLRPSETLGDVATSVAPLLLAVGARRLGELLSVSTRTVRMLDASGRLPTPIRIGSRSVRWAVSEIQAWLACGAPSREVWEAMTRNGKPPR